MHSSYSRLSLLRKQLDSFTWDFHKYKETFNSSTSGEADLVELKKKLNYPSGSHDASSIHAVCPLRSSGLTNTPCF